MLCIALNHSFGTILQALPSLVDGDKKKSQIEEVFFRKYQLKIKSLVAVIVKSKGLVTLKLVAPSDVI